MRRASLVWRIPSIGLIAASVVALSNARAQALQRVLPREPLLVDSPCGDFPLGRLEPGARVRLTQTDGERLEARVLAVADSFVELRLTTTGSDRRYTLAELHALRELDVHALPKWHDQAFNRGALVGAALGALVGAVTHRLGGASASGGRHRSLGEDIAGGAAVASVVGEEVGMLVIGRRRWRPVIVP